ncbi:MAG: PspC domain-containing protein [Flavobacteriaceae bacterium]|nr:PspC domain-containing protein [Flavobacteriaceae bacterium]
MNKTININLGGLFFHIDEEAYQKLNKYLNSIRKSLSDDPQGRDEIIKDIELRISELLTERIVDTRQVVSTADIDEIVKIMGQPEDYNIDEELFNEPRYSHKRRPSKKLYRDSDDKFLGGVASGAGHYIGIEPVWSRILWLVFAFTTGVGFFIYILLWIILPEARSTAEKLEMEGETVNIDNIEKKIREEFNAVSDRVKDGANDISEKISSADYKKYRNKAKSGLQEFLDTVGSILLTLLKIFAKFIGALIIFIAAVALISLVVGAFSIGSIAALGFPGDFIDISPLIFNTILPYWIVAIFFFIALSIPFFVLFMLGIKILSNNTKSLGKVTKLTLLAVWIISILGLVFTGIDMSSRYSNSGIDTTKHDMIISKTDTLNIAMIGNDNFNSGKSYRKNSTKIIQQNSQEKIYATNIGVDIKRSNTNDTYVKIRKSAHGKNYETAKQNAENIEYSFKLNQSSLQLNNYFLNDLKNGFLDQDIDIIIYIPEGQMVYLDNSTKYFLDDISNAQNIYDRDMVKHHYIMTETELKCLDCESDIFHNYTENNVNLKIDDNRFNLKIKSEGGSIEMSVDSSNVTIE